MRRTARRGPGGFAGSTTTGEREGTGGPKDPRDTCRDKHSKRRVPFGDQVTPSLYDARHGDRLLMTSFW